MSRQNSLITLRGNIGSDHQGYKIKGEKYTRLRSYNLALNSENVKTLEQFSPLRSCARDLSVVSSTMAKFFDQLESTYTAFSAGVRHNSHVNKMLLRYLASLGQTRGDYSIPITEDTLSELCRIMNTQARYTLESTLPGYTYDSEDFIFKLNKTTLYQFSIYRQLGFDGFNLASALAWLMVPAKYDTSTGTFTPARVTTWMSSDNVAFNIDVPLANTIGYVTLNTFVDHDVKTGSFVFRSIVLTPYKNVNGNKVYYSGHSTFIFPFFEVL